MCAQATITVYIFFFKYEHCKQMYLSYQDIKNPEDLKVLNRQFNVILPKLGKIVLFPVKVKATANSRLA